MAKWLIALIGGLVFFGVIAVILFVWCVGLYNKEARLRNQIVAKQKDNTWKKISQAAQVTDAQKQALMDIIVGNSKARAGNGNSGQLATFVHEAVPNVDTSTFNQLMNIVTSTRDAWTMRQKELLDFKREHDNLMDVFPGSILFSLLGKTKIDVTIVTSGRTEDAFKTGKDDDIDLFPKKNQPAEK